MTEQEMAEKAVKTMLEADGFSAWLGIELVEIHPGKAKLLMKVRKEMLNGFNICHGGITFSLADSAMAFASNTHGQISMSIENSITYTAKIVEGDTLIANAEEVSQGNKIAVYNVTITREDNTKVALFKGIVYRTRKEFV